MDNFPDYDGLKLDRPDHGVLRITLSRGKANAMDYQMHHDLTSIWPLIDQDSQTSAVILTGAGKLFSAGGDFETEQKMIEDWRYRTTMWKDARDLVQNLLNFSKPLVSAINGSASGAGLAAALLADIAIMARSALPSISLSQLLCQHRVVDALVSESEAPCLSPISRRPLT